MTKKQIFIVFFYSILGIILFFIGGIISLLSAFVSISIYSIIFFGIHFYWIKSVKKTPLFFIDFIWIFLYKISFFLIFCVGIIGSFSYYQNEISPAYMPFYTISNGKKYIKFQTMIHIGTPHFYEKIRKNIKRAKTEGYVLFFEGVKPGKKENMKKFDEALGINFTPTLYENFSRLYGLTFQDNNYFLELVNNYDFNIDLSIDEIIKFYEKIGENKKNNALPKEIQDVDNLVIEELSKLNNKELQILIYINQAIMNFIIKNDSLQKSFLKEFGNEALFEVILNKRNELLVENIEKSKYDKIFITYGLLHFEGVFKKLKKVDKNRKIIKKEYLYPIHN